jgi:hypothetical protein
MGLFHIAAYRAPHLILKRGQRKRHWTPGVLVTWLVIYDMERAEPVCQVNLSVQSDVREASLRWRDRTHTQQTLIEQLGKDLRSRSEEALRSISSELRLPDDGTAPATKPRSAQSHRLDAHRG